MYSDASIFSLNEAGARHGAVQLFNNVFRVGKAARAWARLTGRPTRLFKLQTQAGAAGRHFVGLREVSLKQIVGSEGRADDFDASFRPQHRHTADRWIGIAAARRLGVVLPPVKLIQVGERYFVRDGNHRISVALAMGQAFIEAEVVSAG